MTYERLLEELTVGPRRLRNRVLVTGHTTAYVDADHLPDARDAAYFGARAAGGAAMLCTGTNVVHPSSPLPYGTYAAFDERIVPAHRAIADAVHAHDALMLVQLGHMAQRNYDEPVPTWSPSPIAFHTGGPVPHEMTQAEIREVVAAFGETAARVERAGMDGVEVGLGHGQLINLFLSPLTNVRTDAYGGSFERRMRFAQEVMAAVREAVSDAMLIGARVNGDDEVPGSLDADAWLDVSAAIAATGIPHFLNVSLNFHESLVPTMHTPHGAFLAHARALRARAEVTVPVFATGRITDAADAERAIADGAVDAIGMTRAHIADPDVVANLRAGREQATRPCVGCVQMCIGQVQRGRPISCVYNSVTGAERERGPRERRPAAPPRRVAVVGGGPAGLEAARVAALRGHAVTLIERAERLGSSVALAATAPGRAELARMIPWYEGRLRELGVAVETGRDVNAAELSARDADVVVVATGAADAVPSWAAETGDGTVLGARGALGTPERLTGHVLVVDEDHHGQALFVAAAALARGAAVTVATERLFVASSVERGTRDDLYRLILGGGGRFLPSQRVAALRDRAVRLESMFTGEPTELEADVVVSTAAASDDALARSLADQHELVLIGDALAPRRIDSAVREGFDAAAAL
ncbi:MAG TPA: FAD-dependent oxidoreductase [Conexibacter sp.]|nr:FAD-dependent oxidoreductase [Conexibacter sp.]